MTKNQSKQNPGGTLSETLFAWASRISPGLWIAAVIVALVGGRWAWVHPRSITNEEKIISEYSDVGYLMFRGSGPQPNQDGSRVAYAQTTENGAGVFISDTTSGQRQLVYEDKDRDVPQLTFGAWGWSPDHALLAYARCVKEEVLPRRVRTGLDDRLVIWQAGTGKDLAEFEIKKNAELAKLVWLTPDCLVWVGRDSQAHVIHKETKGKWKQTDITGTKVTPSSLIAISSNTVAWSDPSNIWALSLESNAPAKLFTLNTGRLVDVSYSENTGRFLLQVRASGLDSLRSLDCSPEQKVRELVSEPSISKALWINKSLGGYAYLSRRQNRNVLVVKADPRAEAITLFTNGDVGSISASADGRHLFVEAIVDNELAEDLWEYDIDSDLPRKIVASSEPAAKYAKGVTPTHELVTLPSGQRLEFYLFHPTGFDRHKHRKYPLVIAYTPYVATLSHMAQVCAPALANCGAYVAILRRPGWEARGVEWGDDVMAFYNYLVQDRSIDKSRVFLFSRSRESEWLYQLIAKDPKPWNGVMVLNGSLDSATDLPLGSPGPRILFDVEDSPGEAEHLVKVQEQLLQRGVIMEWFVHHDAPHDFIAQRTLRERTRTMINFVFGG